jgi:antitoxin component YwqK of YwqJK toxin-antitoxin module
MILTNFINRPSSSLQVLLYKRIMMIGCVLTSLGALGQADSLVPVRYTYETGAISSEGTLRNGQPDGYWKTYFRSGQLKTEGNRVNYQLEGPWIFYNEDGTRNVVISYAADKKEGPRIYYSKGKVAKIERWQADQRQGYAEEFKGDSILVRKLPFVNDQLQGTGFEFDSTGTIQTLLTYKSNVLVRKENINRTDQRGMKQGTWVEFYNDLSFKVEGNYFNDLKHGYWKFYKPNGSLLKTEKWVYGVLDERAEEVAKLDMRRTVYGNGKLKSLGGFVNGIPEGVHREYDPDGKVISGVLYNKGIRMAVGITDDQGWRQGKWTFYDTEGRVTAEGSYRNNQRTGIWKYFYSSGKLEQIGAYVKDQPDGEWIWYHENDQIWRKEEYVEGFEDGLSEEFSEDGTLLATGKYVEGEKDGPWVERVGTYREEGSYFEGQRTGDWKGYYSDKEVKWQGRYSNGLEDGTFVFYYPNGKLDWRGAYTAGVKNGLWEYFDESGNRYLTIEYVDGQEVKYNGIKVSYGKRLDKRLERENE